MRFSARTIAGSGRGNALGVPTMNLHLSDVPAALKEGIYACTADDADAVLHYGPRPVFGDTPSCEVHLLESVIDTTPEQLHIEIVQRLRDVRDFSSEEALKEQMQCDIDAARAILQRHARDAQSTAS